MVFYKQCPLQICKRHEFHYPSCIRNVMNIRILIYVFKISPWKRCSVRLCLQLFVGGFMSYLRYLCLFVHSGVQHILCCVFVFYCLRLVYPMLPVSLDCPFLIAPSVFSNVYLLTLKKLYSPKSTCWWLNKNRYCISGYFREGITFAREKQIRENKNPRKYFHFQCWEKCQLCRKRLK